MSDASVLQHYLAPLAPLLEPPGVTELVVNRPGEVGVERAGTWTWHEVPQLSSDWLATLTTAAAAFTRQDIGQTNPLCATVLPGGERCQLVVPPAAEHFSMTVRKPGGAALDLETLAMQGMFDDAASLDRRAQAVTARLAALHAAGDWPAFLRLAVESRKNILVSGATGSGKTTLAKALIDLIPPDERLITLEDTRELTAPHRNRVHLVYARDGQGASSAGPKQLLEAALRMRPDRILLQELRDGTAFFYLRNVSSGHPGSITTLHADSAALAFEQLTLLVRESDGGRDLPRDDIRALLFLLVDVVVQVRREGGRFRVAEVYFNPERKGAAADGVRTL